MPKPRTGSFSSSPLPLHSILTDLSTLLKNTNDTPQNSPNIQPSRLSKASIESNPIDAAELYTKLHASLSSSVDLLASIKIAQDKEEIEELRKLVEKQQLAN